jgi:hypothetical protein
MRRRLSRTSGLRRELSDDPCYNSAIASRAVVMSNISNDAVAGAATYKARERVLIAGALGLVVCRLISAVNSVAAMVVATLIVMAVVTCYVRGWPWGRRWAFRCMLPLAIVANSTALAVGVLVAVLAETGLLVQNRLGVYLEWNREFLCVPLAGLLTLLALAWPTASLRFAAWIANGLLIVYAACYWFIHETYEAVRGAPPLGADLVVSLAAISIMCLAWESPQQRAPAAGSRGRRVRAGLAMVAAGATFAALTPAFLTVVRRCRSEAAVTSQGCEVTDRSRRMAALRIRELAPLRPYVTEIEAIYIPKDALTPANCASLSEAIGNLKMLYEIDAAVVPEGCDLLLRRLPPTSRMEFLMLSGPGVTDSMLADVGSCKRLTILTLVDSRITDDGLRQIAGLRSLRSLVLRRARVSGAGLRQLTVLPGLSSLDLADTPIGDDDVGALTQMPALVSLDLRGTRVTLAGVQQIQRALPRCQIDWGKSP